ncbi:hypothetical protein MM213_13795 [Belliella sp. R4-6]|uniref:HNH nuclease domain-containing protein n=1 Tax=Belliella alkalica TaxID=1730871 RepID=A0ABS9VDS6_9BACT|nr:HNH endonuclease domain-containing protein [Belliella alkalica]MCH7414567.1 hypothetical protein [Belliella alkalica]
MFESGKNEIYKKEIFATMIANSWYTINYFNLSFGVQDQFQKAIIEIQKIENITIQEKKHVIQKILIESENNSTIKILNHFNKNVPHYFLSPWISGKNSEIYNYSQNVQNRCLYALFNDRIIINPYWEQYLLRNAKIIKDFCYWNLALYLQARNPSVPDIPNKLIKSAERSPLTDQRKNFWNLVFQEKVEIKCIYTGEMLTIDNYDVEHFIPHSFVSHDLIWNLIPSDKRFNSSKNNKLPIVNKHFNAFFDLQKEAVKIVFEKNPKNKFLLEYLTIFPELSTVENLSVIFDKNRFEERIIPLITIASNNGFQFLP